MNAYEVFVRGARVCRGAPGLQGGPGSCRGPGVQGGRGARVCLGARDPGLPGFVSDSFDFSRDHLDQLTLKFKKLSSP